MKGVLRIPQSSSITRASPSDSLMSHPEHSSYTFEEMQLVYSTALAKKTQNIGIC